jgi:hypothetical protein
MRIRLNVLPAVALLAPFAAALGGCGLEFAAGAVAGGVAGHEIADKDEAAMPETAPAKAPAAAPRREAAAEGSSAPPPLPTRKPRPPAAERSTGRPVSPANRELFEEFMRSRDGGPPAP